MQNGLVTQYGSGKLQDSKSGHSKIDDNDVTLNFPVGFETGIKTSATATTSAWTGFHPVSFLIDEAYLKCYPQNDVGEPNLVGKLRLWGIATGQMNNSAANTQAVKVVMAPYYAKADDTEVPLAANGLRPEGAERLAGWYVESVDKAGVKTTYDFATIDGAKKVAYNGGNFTFRSPSGTTRASPR